MEEKEKKTKEEKEKEKKDVPVRSRNKKRGGTPNRGLGWGCEANINDKKIEI